MTLSDSLTTKINELATAIHNKIASVKTALTTHENTTSSSLQKGHSQAGGAPQTIGQSLSAGTDNGYYARADHVHTVDYTNILNKPTSFNPSTHDHDTLYYTKGEINELLNDVVIDRIFIDENGNITIGTSVAGMLLNGNKNTIQSNETVILTATAYDLYSDVVYDQPLQLYKDDVLLGIYNTNSDGQISYTYTGNGSGEHNFVVRHGRFQSEPYTVYDSLMFDSGILNDPQRNTNDWLNWNNYLTVTADANGTLLNNTSANSGYIYLFKHGHTSTDFYVWDYGSCIEFDLVDCSDLTKCFFQVVASGSGEIIFGNENLSVMGITVGSHIKVNVTSSRATVYVDGVEKYHKDHSYSNLFRIDVAIISGYTFKFRNLRVYPI